MRARKRLEFSIDAVYDIEAIEFYYSVEKENTRAADNLVAAIFKAASSLEHTPEIGRPGSVGGTRELILTKYPYTIIYRLTPSRAIVLNILHQSRQYP